MDDYTKEDVIKSLSLINPNNRKRVLVDQRSYLIAILAFRFMLSEHKISVLTGIKRDKINYNKRLALQYFQDKSYIQNIYVYSVMYPFDLSIITASSRKTRLKKIEILVESKVYNKLKTIGSILNHKDIRTTVKFLIDKNLKLWDE